LSLLLRRRTRMDRTSGAKTRFALLPVHDGSLLER
jgi:hypothetical protein